MDSAEETARDREPTDGFSVTDVLPCRAGFSMCEYSPDTGLLVAKGWALGKARSVRLIDQSHAELGVARLGEVRLDVTENYPDYDDDAPGWTFSTVYRGDLSAIDPVIAEVEFASEVITVQREARIISGPPSDKATFVAQAELVDAVEKIGRHVTFDDAMIATSWSKVRTRQDVHAALLDAALDGDILRLRNGSLRIADRASARTLLFEVFGREEYFFRSDSDTPRILDGGAHCGVSLAYFKSIYPGARIVAFEPVADNFALLEENVARNGWSDVVLEPYALGARDGTAEFYMSNVDSMAGTLTTRLHEKHELGSVERVEIRRLGAWIDGPVDLLKLDIEGAEFDVFEDIEDKLNLIDMIVCEVHIDATNQTAFGQLMARLADQGFVCEISRAWYFALAENIGHPLEEAGRPYSLTLWARKP